MKKILMGAAVFALLASPALAQSYDPDFGSGNLVQAPWGNTPGSVGNEGGFANSAYAYAPARHHVRRSRGLDAQAYVPGAGWSMGNPGAVYAFGRYQGADPDPNVRLELRRDDISGY